MKEYTITLPDGMETTVLLTDEDAKARGLKPAAAASKSGKPANKAQQPANKSAATSKALGAKGDA